MGSVGTFLVIIAHGKVHGVIVYLGVYLDTFLVIIAHGKFHGVIAAHTPTGWRITTIRRPATGDETVSPYTCDAEISPRSRRDHAEIAPRYGDLGAHDGAHLGYISGISRR